MRKYLIIAFLFPIYLFGQITIPYSIPINNGKVPIVNGKVEYYQPPVRQYLFPYNQTPFGSDSITILDYSGKGNNATLAESSCFYNNSTGVAILAPTSYVTIDDIRISFDGEMDAVTQPPNYIFAHYNSGNRIFVRMESGGHFQVMLGSATTFTTTTIHFYTGVKFSIQFRVVGNGDGTGTFYITSTFTGHSQETYNKTYTGLSTLATNIKIGSNDGETLPYAGKIWRISVNGSLSPTNEGYGDTIFDVSGLNKHLQISSNYNQWNFQNYYHYNIFYGYSLFETAVSNNPNRIRVPYKNDKTPLIQSNFNIGGYLYKLTQNFPAGNFHNHAETKIKNTSLYDPYGFWGITKRDTIFLGNNQNYVFSDISDSGHLSDIITFGNYYVDRKPLEKTIKRPNYKIYIIWAQSNGLSMNPPDSLPSTYWGTQKTSFIYANQLRYIDPLTHNTNYPGSGNYCGLEVSFAPEMKKHLADNENILIIKYAIAGSCLYYLSSPSDCWNIARTDSYYTGLKTVITNCINYLKSIDATYSFDGIIQFQGESDANATYEPTYKQSLKDLIGDIRTFLGNTTPYYICKIHEGTANYPYTTYINNDFDEIATEMTGIHVIQTSDLTWKSGTDPHLNMTGILNLGIRIANIIYP